MRRRTRLVLALGLAALAGWPVVSAGRYACAPIGATTIIPHTGKSFPVKGEDFGYLVWRKRNCCML